ncbi:MAG TPA: 4-alpha-glucanotransferase [Candidimonas sp.]|nr:4-alpha-glucanotransferase [Candidimonas sp.]
MSSPAPIDFALLRLSQAAGLVPVWKDVHGQEHQVKEPVLRSMLNTLGLSCGSVRQIAESLDQLAQESSSCPDSAMFIVDVGESFVFPYVGSLAYVLTLEDGKHHAGAASCVGPGRVSIPGITQPGYHSLSIGQLQLTLAVAPQRSPSVKDIAGRPETRHWGIAAQVYSLCRFSISDAPSGDDMVPSSPMPIWPGWAVGGDFGALARLATHAGRAQASALAISPVHAMFSADPLRCSPYSPSSRLFLNAAYIDPAIVLGEPAVRQAMGELGLDRISDGACAASTIDWASVLPRRLAVLGRLFDSFRNNGVDHLMQRYTAFRQRGGEALESHGRYEALHAHHQATLGPASGWQDWPANFHDPLGKSVQIYAAQHEAEISFHVFLQWLADEGLQYAQHSARDAGMPIGLITDLAIGTDPRGSYAWSRQGQMLAGVSVGAPPDLFQPQGQYWGLTALSPRALRQNAYLAFLETLQAALAHAGGVRIDHILGLARMWLIPQGASAADGVYLRYPRADMMRLLALEAWRHKAIVIGENLGTVPEGFNETLSHKGILGTNVLWFQRSPGMVHQPDSVSGPDSMPASETAAPIEDSAGFLSPRDWSSDAIAMTTTHDLPTLAGWWAGRDLAWRERLGQLPDDETARQAATRLHDKTALWCALQAAGCISEQGAGLPAAAPRDALLAFVSDTPAPLVMVPLEDLLGLVDQPNLPGSEVGGHSLHPNWSQCLPVDVDQIFTRSDVKRGIQAIKQARRQA